MRPGRRAGFTLIELIVSITLLSAILTGMLMAMRGGLLTLERVQSRIQDSRGALGLDQMIRRQIGGAVPATGLCALGDPSTAMAAAPSPVFRGTATAMLWVTSFSMTEGARGYPHLVEYRVLPNNDGTSRLVAEEMLFASPATTTNYCSPPGLLKPLAPAGTTTVLLPRLASARFSYREVNPETRLGGKWLPAWIVPDLPYSVRIDLQPAGAAEIATSIAVPLHITRSYQEFYADRP